jgi:hypothetical protein
MMSARLLMNSFSHGDNNNLSISDTAPSGPASRNIPPHVATISIGFATWSTAPDLVLPDSANYDDNNNWSDGTTPGGSDTAFFGTSSITNILLPASLITLVGSWVFNAGASSYTFVLPNISGLSVFNFTGAGITIDGGSATIYNSYFLQFENNSTADGATLVNEAVNNSRKVAPFITFYDSSSAANAAITNYGVSHIS